MSDGLIFRCPGCDAEFEADLKLIGTESECPECHIRFVVPTPTPEEGMVIAGFKLKKRLGEGGMGEVWLADQVAMSRQVAVKLLSPSLVSKEDFVQRFFHEVKMSGRLDHPNIITAFDAGQVQGFFYLAMGYVDGVELADRLKIDRTIPELEALQIAREIAGALEYAWNEHRILHRDIKPSNIMLDQKGHAKLMDMGISKSFKDAGDLTMSGTIVGTPYYISPEQGRADRNIDFRADVYSLGATLYHMVTGYFAFDGETTMAIVSKHIHQPLVSPRQLNPNLSILTCALIEKMMAKKAEERQASWKNVIADIDLVIAGKMPEKGPGQPEEEVSPSSRTVTLNVNRTMIHNPAVDTSSSGGVKIKINTSAQERKTASTATAAAAASPASHTGVVSQPEQSGRPKTPLSLKTTPPPSGPASSSGIMAPPAVPKRPFPLTLIFSLAAGLLLLLAVVMTLGLFKSIDRLRLVSVDGKDLAAIEQIVDDLERKARALMAEGKKDEAVKLINGYQGPMTGESAGRRQILLKQLDHPVARPALPKLARPTSAASPAAVTEEE